MFFIWSLNKSRRDAMHGLCTFIQLQCSRHLQSWLFGGEYCPLCLQSAFVQHTYQYGLWFSREPLLECLRFAFYGYSAAKPYRSWIVI